MLRGEPPGHVRAVAADHDRHARLLEWLRAVDGARDRCVLAAEPGSVRVTGLEHPRDDLEMVRQGREPLTRRREVVAVGLPLLALPAGAVAEVRAAAADRIER